MNTTFTLLMLTRCSTMKETEAAVFCQCDRADRAERIADAMRKEYVSDFQIVTKQGRRTTHGPILRSYRVNRCLKCLREYTYNDLQEAKEAGSFIGCDLSCSCGCLLLVDWNFKGQEKPLVWSQHEFGKEPATGEQPTANLAA
jgi:hypothetical protein